MKRAAKTTYVFPEEKKFPVGDKEHERKALAYIKAGRCSVEQIVPVLEYLARYAKDKPTKSEARTALANWRTSGTGLVRMTLKTLKAKSRKLKRNPSGDLYIDVYFPEGAGSTAFFTPSGEKNLEAVRRGIAYALADARPGKARSEWLAGLMETDWVGRVDKKTVQGYMGRARRISRLPEGTRNQLWEEVKVPWRTFMKWLNAYWGLKITV